MPDFIIGVYVCSDCGRGRPSSDTGPCPHCREINERWNRRIENVEKLIPITIGEFEEILKKRKFVIGPNKELMKADRKYQDKKEF